MDDFIGDVLFCFGSDLTIGVVFEWLGDVCGDDVSSEITLSLFTDWVEIAL